MPIAYDSASEEFVLNHQGVVRRFEVGRAPTLENALDALELLNTLRATTRKTEARPDPLGIKHDPDAHAKQVYLNNGGIIQRCGIAPELLPEKKSRLKSPLSQIKTGAELLAALGLNKETYK